MKQLLALAISCCLLGVACSNSDDGNEVVVPTDEPAPTSVTITPAGSDGPPTAGMTVGELLASEQREATVSGAVVWDQSSARLCDVLMESFPPQCGAPSVVITNPEMLTVDLQASGNVRWTDNWVDLSGFFDGNHFTLDAAAPNFDVEPADEALVAAFVAFAQAPGPGTLAAVPLADTVALGLGPEIVMSVERMVLAEPSRWVIDRTEFRAWSGPFSALDLAGEPYLITIGPHNRCASPPEPAPTGFRDLRRVSLEPTDATSCLEWWTIDLFVDDAGNIQAITLDLFAP